MTTPRIYVACLASYNAGKLYGAWIDVSDEDIMREEIAAMLRASPCPNVEVECPHCEGHHQDRVCTKCVRGKVPSAEEWAIHDHEGFEGLLNLREYPDLEKIALHARMLEEHDGAWVAYVNHVGEHYATEEGFEDDYRGHYPSPEDYAQSLHEDAGTDLGSLAQYIDWEAVARDMQMNGDYNFVDDPNGGVYVFSNH